MDSSRNENGIVQKRTDLVGLTAFPWKAAYEAAMAPGNLDFRREWLTVPYLYKHGLCQTPAFLLGVWKFGTCQAEAANRQWPVSSKNLRC